MSARKNGFTLIEVLMVVLIIGILVAIALPKYENAVDQSRYSTLMPMAKSVANAQESFYMANNRYSENLGDLDVDLPYSLSGQWVTVADGTTIWLSNEADYDYVKLKADGMDNYYLLYQAQSKNYKNEAHCEALATSNRAMNLCISLGGEEISGNTMPGYRTYVLEGTGAGTPREIPREGECVHAVSKPGCKGYFYLDGSSYETWTTDDGTLNTYYFSDTGKTTYRKSEYADGHTTESWYDENGVRTRQIQQGYEDGRSYEFFYEDGVKVHQIGRFSDGSVWDWYYENNEVTRGEFTTASGVTGEVYYEDGVAKTEIDYRTNGTIGYWEDMNTNNPYNIIYNADGSVGRYYTGEMVDGVYKDTSGVFYNNDGAITSSYDYSEPGTISARYTYNSDGTYVMKPEATKNDQSTWEYGTYTTGNNGDVTRSDGVTLSGRDNHQPLCETLPHISMCNS